MSFHRSCCDKIPEGECFPYGMDVSFLDLYNDTGGDCGDCPIDGGCTGAFIEGVEILGQLVNCYCENYHENQEGGGFEWTVVPCPTGNESDEYGTPCNDWHTGVYEFWHCSQSCVNSNAEENEDCWPNTDGEQFCQGPPNQCACASLYRMVCNEEAEDCIEGLINRKCCSRLHVHYGAYHDGEKYWLPNGPMVYFPGGDEVSGINCKRQCGSMTLSTAPVCQGEQTYYCDPSVWGGAKLWCSPVGCCGEENQCGNCPSCAGPDSAPFCCESSPTDVCGFYAQDEKDPPYYEHWSEWCVAKHGAQCYLNYEPYYWKYCGVGGWDPSGGDSHISRMYCEDDDVKSPTYGEQIPCDGVAPGHTNSALYDIYDLTGGGGGMEPFVPHVLILYGEHIRQGSRAEVKASYTVKGWWVSCTTNDNMHDLPIEGNDPDCHCEDSPTADVGACCTEEDGTFYCQDLEAGDCADAGGEWDPQNVCSDDPCG